MKIRLFALGQISMLHALIVFLSLMLTLGAWQFSKIQSDKQIEQRFNASRDRVVGLIKNRMLKYEDALWSGVAAIESHGGDVTLEQWRIFAKNLRIDEKYPGINGIGVIHFLSESSVDDYLEQRRAERPFFEIFPQHDHNIYMPISFIEPEVNNVQAIGLDVAHELNRRTAALLSRDKGTSQITGPIVLVQDAGETPGFLFYAPFYQGGFSTSPGDRQNQIIGVVYAPFVVRSLLDGLLSKDLRSTSISISDSGATIYDEHAATEELYDPQPMFVETIPLEFYGRNWSLDIRSNLDFRADNMTTQPAMILTAGMIIEALILSLLIMMARANRHAIAYADDVTKKLRVEQNKLIRTNEELEQFAYAASHDLKTPIRGIAGLTEMVIEDLEEYLSSPNANPEVAMGLDLILDRVKRMNDLTGGIIAFSRIGTQEQSSDPLCLTEMLASLVSDFNLEPHQIVLHSQVEKVPVDPVSLRRVFENLIGNAVKYHDDVKDLEITVTCHDNSHSLEFSVKDNGPGIHPKYQERVFKMFQTLRAGDAQESTGIGLAVVKKAVEIHGGTVQLKSSEGHGAEFIFQWPNQETLFVAAEPEIAA